MIRRSIQTGMQQFATAAMKMRRAADCFAQACRTTQCSDRQQQQQAAQSRFALVI